MRAVSGRSHSRTAGSPRRPVRRSLRLTAVAFGLAGLMAATPVLAAEPFGSFGGKVGGGNSGAGVVRLHGWALDDDGVRAVDVFVDGVIDGRANYGRNRPGVTRLFPSFPDADAAGFGYRLDTTRYLNGLHTVEVRVTSESGERVFLNPVEMEFLNTTHNLKPFGQIDFPNKSAELYGTCDMEDSPRRLSVVDGWVLDVGVETGDMGVGWVELLIDGAIYANSRTDCFYDEAFGGLTNCYGLRRLDVERIFPQLEDAPLSGFRFVLDIGFLVDFGFTEGRHTLTVRSGDISGQVANVAEIPVDFLCDNRLGNEEGLGWIAPVKEQNISDGLIQIDGWALDWEGVSRVVVYIDGREVGVADFGLVRPQINLRYPGYPDSMAAGWRLIADSTDLANGRHDVQVFVFDRRNESTLIGERDFFVQNP